MLRHPLVNKIKTKQKEPVVEVVYHGWVNKHSQLDQAIACWSGPIEAMEDFLQSS